jgi:hypothetical protein
MSLYSGTPYEYSAVARGLVFPREPVSSTSPVDPLFIAHVLACSFQNPHGAARTPRAILGVASRRGLLFENHNLRGTSVGIVAIVCPT